MRSGADAIASVDECTCRFCTAWRWNEAVVARRLVAVGVEANNARPTDEASPLYVPVPNRHKAMVDELLERVIPHAGAN